MSAPVAVESAVEWQWSAFDELDTHALYAILAQRQDVFVLEQQCLFQDLDGIDQLSHHLLAWQMRDGRRVLSAYLRSVPPGINFAEASLGRVLCARAARGTGLGKRLFAEGVRRIVAQYPGQPVRIGAQQYLEQFYAGFGFQTCSQPYLEDAIWHVEMVRPG
jgi:ElaA protein